MLFFACRVGDLINVFVGLWLVPKYVNQAELGAVLPLTSFATFLAFPISVFTIAYTRQVAELGAREEYGKLKSLMRGVFIVAGILIVVSIIISRLILPHFLERIRIANGSLGIIILCCAFAGALAPIYGAALQALKKFTALTALTLVTAPLRLVVMATLMPFRPLSGYFCGQTAPSVASIGAAIWALRKELSTAAAPFWREHWRQFFRFTLSLSIINGVAAFNTTIQAMILRQRLPEIDSAAFYMISRFSEIATYAGCTVAVILFPIAAHAHATGSNATDTLIKANRATLIPGIAISVLLFLFGKQLLSAIPTCEPYCSYNKEMALVALSSTIGTALNNFISFENAQNRLNYFYWVAPITIGFSLFLVSFTGCDFFHGILPPHIIAWMRSLKIGDNLLNFVLSTLTPGVIMLLIMHLIIKKRKRL